MKEFKDIDWDDWDIEENDPEINNIFIGNEFFYNFLVKNHFLDMYIEKYDKTFGNQNRTLKEFLKHEKPINFLSNAFYWRNIEIDDWVRITAKWSLLQYNSNIVI